MILPQSILLLLNFAIACNGFNPSSASITIRHHQTKLQSTTSEKPAAVEGQTNGDGTPLVDLRTGKPTGVSYLPSSTVQRARENGSPIEKIKLEKDGTSAFVDVYEYAKKIRNGEMTWEEVDKADLDTVRIYISVAHVFSLRRNLPVLIILFLCTEIEMGRYATPCETYARSIHDAITDTQWNNYIRPIAFLF